MENIENKNLPVQPQYIYVQQPRFNEADDEVEIDLVELFKSIWKKKWRIFIFSVFCGLAAMGYAFTLPFIYKAESKIVPSGGGGGKGGGLSSLAASYGGIASMMGIDIPSNATSGGTLMEVMKSNSVVDAVIDRFNMMEENKWEIRLNARKAVTKILDIEEDKTSAIITVSYTDKDPQKAADIVKAFIEETQKKLLDMSISQSKSSREFYENQLMEAQQELTEAEEAMMAYQKSSGVIVMETQAKALIDAIANLRSQIAAKNIEITSLKSYARRDNPTLKLAQSELEGMERELRRLEEEQRKSDTGRVRRGGISGDLMLSVGQIPELGIEYERNLRALKIAGAKYELMFRQYESARLGEINDIATITIIDPPMPPDFRDSPSRGKITLIGGFVGGFLSTCFAGWPNFKKQMSRGKKKKEYDDEDDDDE